MTARLICGDVRDVLPTLDACSVDAVVTDPPYELGFMGKRWDDSGIAYDVDMWREVWRVAKPGAHLLAFGGTRTHHRLMVALEDAGFEIRDCLMWIFGSGFPKSLDVSKAIDKAAGAERENLGRRTDGRYAYGKTDITGGRYIGGENGAHITYLTAPATPEAAQWDGWGTALKPAYEPIILARKPLSEPTVAANVLRWGTGAINVDGCRIAATDKAIFPAGHMKSGAVYAQDRYTKEWRSNGDSHPTGRWPANLLLSHSLFCTDDACDESCPVAMLDAQSGYSEGKTIRTHRSPNRPDSQYGGHYYGQDEVEIGYPDRGGASRFFYCAKSSRAERERGLDDLMARPLFWSAGTQNPGSFQSPNTNRSARNHHPTVKPLALMRYLVRLVTPPGGVVLDPFLGSGTTALACAAEGFDCIGIEREPEYVEIARRRIEAT